ncbi:hypothetical protein N7527_009733 [Penicillium freii]|uniref:Uncharacterized protein n=1 Tax=Penicillium freii TaxID=48697 RepID=A0A101MLU0_PENFR|nr:hypothetical protein N7527_009733 [Penicillium freii]KUM62911.1 hypothetical protein ACN42_g4165 [Penicillium freii]
MFCGRLPTSAGYISTFDITPHLNSFVLTYSGLICEQGNHTTSIIGLVVEFVVAIDEARVRFTDDAQQFLFCNFAEFLLAYGEPFLILLGYRKLLRDRDVYPRKPSY